MLYFLNINIYIPSTSTSTSRLVLVDYVKCYMLYVIMCFIIDYSYYYILISYICVDYMLMLGN